MKTILPSNRTLPKRFCIQSFPCCAQHTCKGGAESHHTLRRPAPEEDVFDKAKSNIYQSGTLQTCTACLLTFFLPKHLLAF